MLSYLQLRSAGWAVGLAAVLLAACQSADIEPAEFDYYSSGYTPELADTPVTPPPDYLSDFSTGGTNVEQATVVTVQKGDSLYGLSRRYLGDGKRWREIASLNGLSDADVRRLAVGRELRMPIR